MPFVPLPPADLRLGLFIKIEGSWFSHPFPTNSFKISTAKDLATLQTLPNAQLLVDFDRSDPDPMAQPDSSQPLATDPSQDIPSGNGAAEEKERIPRSIERESSRSPSWEQRDAFHEYQAHLQQVENQYQEVLQESKQTMHDVVSGRPRGLRTAQKVVDELLDLLDGSDKSRALLNLIGSHEPNEEFFLHALNVCSLSLMVGLDLGFTREENQKLALGGFFHDVGELKFPAETLLRKGTMGKGELKNFLSAHPKFGTEMTEKIPNFPYEAVEVIRQHHERLDGSGYPSGKRASQISKFAQIVMVVDLYDELCHHSDPTRSLMPSEALSYLYVKCRQTLWNDAVVSLVKQLGVYPPGSLVHLSSKKIGMVTSVNAQNRLRPIVLLYDEQASQQEPLVMNLAEEDASLTIVKSIRPADLSPKIRECLNPRRFISYFPSIAPVESCVTQ